MNYSAILSEQARRGNNQSHSSKLAKVEASLTNASNERSQTFRGRFDLSRLASSFTNKESIIRDTPRSSAQSSLIIHPRSSKAKQEVESIIFDSKVEKTESLRCMLEEAYSGEHHISAFREKVMQVNSQIEAGIDNLQKMIEDLRSKKASLQEHPNNEQAESQYQHQLDSRVQLKCDENAERVFPQEYTTLINRLANQVQIDIDFTQMVNELQLNNELAEVKIIIFAELAEKIEQVNATFFEIEPSELDPLQKKLQTIIKHDEQWLRDQATHLWKKYKEIQHHFESKLKRNYPAHIIGLLFEQLSKSNFTLDSSSESTVSIGQLLSYLNMRTGNSFRNRSFVKMMKRLSLKPNGCLSVSALQALALES